MPYRENVNIVKRAKRMAEILAFGEPTHARPIASELAWRSLNRGLGHSNNFASLSLSLIAQTRATYLLFYAHPREQIYFAFGEAAYARQSESKLSLHSLNRSFPCIPQWEARTLNSEKTAEILEQTKQMHAWILEKLKEKSSIR